MKTIHFLLIAGGLLAGCSAPSDQASTNTPSAPTPASSAAQAIEAAPKQASATGTIESIDNTAKTMVISHGPVPELGWPAMTMTFQAPDVDLTGYGPGDRIGFDMSVTGMTATVSAIDDLGPSDEDAH